jgi:hypothetical protein
LGVGEGLGVGVELALGVVLAFGVTLGLTDGEDEVTTPGAGPLPDEWPNKCKTTRITAATAATDTSGATSRTITFRLALIGARWRPTHGPFRDRASRGPMTNP